MSYVTDLGKERLAKEITNPIFGKPYIKFGHCLTISSYFMGVGLILGVRFRNALDSLWPPLFGLEGEPGEGHRYVSTAFNNDILPHLGDTMTLFEFLLDREARKDGRNLTPDHFLLKVHGTKLTPGSALALVAEATEKGVVLGAASPDRARAMFEQTYQKVNASEWDEARSHGLAISATQKLLTFSEAETVELETFERYCQSYHPKQHAELSAYF